ncbi:unnamed protein product [Peronospora effusa]|nr:unnamed protein product [Peronospora effusa]
MTTRDKDTATRSRKKQRGGGASSSTNTRGKFAFGSRLSIARESLLKRPKKSETARLYTSVQKRQENAVRTSALSRKRSRSSSRDSDEGTSRTKPPHRTLTMKTVLPPSSNLPVPTKVSHLLKSPRVSLSHQKREVTEEQELVADLDATEPAFWIKRRKFVEAAMKELDSIGYVYTHLVQDT